MPTKKQPAMRPSETPVAEVLDRIVGPRRAEAEDLVRLHTEVSGEEPVVWAGRIIGFGQYEYRYESGHSGIAPLLGFATSSSQHTIYLVSGFAQRWPEILEGMGTHRSSKACLYFARLSRIDQEALRGLLTHSLKETQNTSGG